MKRSVESVFQVIRRFTANSQVSYMSECLTNPSATPKQLFEGCSRERLTRRIGLLNWQQDCGRLLTAYIILKRSISHGSCNQGSNVKASSLYSSQPTQLGSAQAKSLKKEREGSRQFNFAAYHTRYVAIELLYLGGAYQGFATQAETQETIEGHLFRAMTKVRLIPPGASWQELKYSRGGRTDKGVSALGQVVALNLRSLARLDQPLPTLDQELDYPSALNRALPHDIRILGWTPVPEDFSARFSASHREYKYFLVQGGGLDVGRMAEAAAHFVGDHDYRNFCKVDALHVNTFRRSILDFRIQPVGGCHWGGRQLYELYIKGTAFLWHQVRCMAAVLLMVGRGEEDPAIVKTLLDVHACPRKPQYCLAAEAPLLLYSCSYDGLQFRRGVGNYLGVRALLSDIMDRQLIAAGMVSTILGRLGSDGPLQEEGLKKDRGGSRHIKLLHRAQEPAVEERLAKHGRQLAPEAGKGAGSDIHGSACE